MFFMHCIFVGFIFRNIIQVSIVNCDNFYALTNRVYRATKKPRLSTAMITGGT